MKKIIAVLLNITIVFTMLLNVNVVFASNTELVAYFNESIINGSYTVRDSGSDLFIDTTGTKTANITVTGASASSLTDSSYDAEVVDAYSLIGGDYDKVGKGAYGEKIIKYTQNAGFGMLRFKNHIPKTTFVAGDKVKLAMRVYLTDIHDSFGVVDTDKSVTSLKARVGFNVNGSDNWSIVGTAQDIETNKWQIVSGMTTLNETTAAALNAGALGMRFDFNGVTGNNANIKSFAFAGTVFYDDYFVIEKTGTATDSFTDWSLTPDDNNGMAKLTKNNVSTNNTITFTIAGAYADTSSTNYAPQKATARVVTAGEIKSDYTAVANGLDDSKHLVKLSQNANMSMLRMVNAMDKTDVKEGEWVDVTMRMYLTDIKKGAQKSGEALEADTTTTALTGRFALRTTQDVEYDDVSIPVNQWVTVTKRFRVTKDHSDVHGFRFDFKGGTNTKGTYYDIPFASTIFFDGTYSISKVTDEHNTFSHSCTLNADAATATAATVSFNAVNPTNDTAVVIVAGYDGDNRLVAADVVNIAANENGVSHTANLAFEAGKLKTVKLMYWDSLTGLVPKQEVTTVYNGK